MRLNATSSVLNQKKISKLRWFFNRIREVPVGAVAKLVEGEGLQNLYSSVQIRPAPPKGQR